MYKDSSSNQSNSSIDKNISFFRDNLESYGKKIQDLDTYMNIRMSINNALKGINRLLDIGNGGVFDYDINLIPDIVALDLFLKDIDTSAYPSFVSFKTGSALNIPEANESFDGVIMVMLLHHLVGKSVDESLNNVRVAIHEAIRVLEPGGKLIVVESCVPTWFYTFEKAIFPLASKIINWLLSHPVTIQYPVDLIAEIASADSSHIEILRIPKGRWVLQYGYKFPSMLTPVNPYRLIIRKPNSEKLPKGA
jgi:SAM-dependent methyltransferase